MTTWAAKARSLHPAQVLLPLGLGTALSLMGDATLYTVLPTHTADAGITLASVGLMLGVNRAIRLLLNGPAGLAYDRWPRRRLFLPALFIGALSTALCAATRGFWPLLLGRMIWGLAWSGIWVGGATMILDVAATAERGRWTGLYQTWFFLGSATGSFGGGVLTDALGYHGALWVGAALTLLGALAAWWLLPETFRAREPHLVGASTLPDADPATEPPTKLRSNPQLWFAVLLHGFNRFLVAGVISATLGLLVAQHLSSPGIPLGVATLTGLLMSGRTLLSMAAAPPAGTLSDRVGSRYPVTLWGLLVGTGGLALLAWGAPVGILVGTVVIAVSRGGVEALPTTMVGDLVSRAQRGRAIGLLHTVGDLGSALGPAVAYASLTRIGLGGTYWWCTLLSAGSVWLAWRFCRQQGIGWSLSRRPVNEEAAS